MGLIQTKNDENRKLSKTKYDLNCANDKNYFFSIILFFTAKIGC